MRRYTALLVAVVLSACSGGGSTTTQTAETTPATTGASSAPATTAAGSPLDTRLDWIADALSRGEVTETEYEATFTSDFLEAVSHDEFVAGLQQLGGEGQLQWSGGEFEEREDTSAVVLLVSDGGEAHRANIVIEQLAPCRIAARLLQPAGPTSPHNPPARPGPPCSPPSRPASRPRRRVSTMPLPSSGSWGHSSWRCTT